MGLKQQQSALSAAVLANANELVCLTVMELTGGELASSIEGSPLTRGALYALTQSKIQSAFASVLEGV